MILNDILKDFQSKIEERIETAIPNAQPKNIFEPFKYIMAAGGKRIRPALTMLACGAVGADPYKALDCGVAIEIMHNFTLVHDDIMDKSPMRRSRETVHVKWNDAVAILAGDYMIGFGYGLLPGPALTPRFKEIFDAYTYALKEVCEGQVYDMDFNDRKDVTLDEYLLMIEKKTSRLLESCVLMGANIGEGTKEQIDALQNYAVNVGLAFQIQDDMLDMTADQLKLGKQIGQDIMEGKKTFLVLTALEKISTTEDKALIDKFYNESGLGAEYVPKFREMFDRIGVFTHAQDTVDFYFDNALEVLNKIPQNGYVNLLRHLVFSLNKRVF